MSNNNRTLRGKFTTGFIYTLYRVQQNQPTNNFGSWQYFTIFIIIFESFLYTCAKNMCYIYIHIVFKNKIPNN